MKFIEAGTETSTKASHGVSYSELRAQVVSTIADHDLMLTVWPDNLATDAQEAFGRAIEGWQLALELWALKFNRGDNPTAPDINGFDRYLAYGATAMQVERHDSDYLVEAYRGQDFLPFDSNIQVLLNLAKDSFDDGRDKILGKLEAGGGS